jgi:hypothetical protein
MYSSRKLREWGATNYKKIVNTFLLIGGPGTAAGRSVRLFPCDPWTVRGVPGTTAPATDMIVFFVLLSVQSQHVSSDGHV